MDQNEETQDFEKKLMECCICNEIVHPGCLQVRKGLQGPMRCQLTECLKTLEWSTEEWDICHERLLRVTEGSDICSEAAEGHRGV